MYVIVSAVKLLTIRSFIYVATLKCIGVGYSPYTVKSYAVVITIV